MTRNNFSCVLMFTLALSFTAAAHGQTQAQAQALRDARSGNWAGVLKALDTKTISPSIADSSQNTLAHLVFEGSGGVAVLDQLAARGVSLEAQNKQGQTPLLLALNNWRHAEAGWMLRRGVQVSGKIEGVDTAATLLSRMPVVARIYYDEARKRNRPVHSAYLADTLGMALFRGDEKSVMDKLVNGAVPELEDLYLAVLSGNPGLVRMLIDGFFITNRNAQALAALAAYAGASPALEVLCKANLDIDADMQVQHYGDIPRLSHLSQGGYKLAELAIYGARQVALAPVSITLQILVDLGYKPTSQTANLALEQGLDDESIMFILKNCENPEIPPSDFETLHDIAVKKGRSPALLTFIEENATRTSDKALGAIKSGRVELFAKSFSLLDADGKLEIARTLFEARMDEYEDEKKRKAFEPFMHVVYSSGLDLNATAWTERRTVLRSISAIPLWALLVTDRASLGRAVQSGADLCAAVPGAYGEPAESLFLSLLSRLDGTPSYKTPEQDEIHAYLEVMIPLLPNPAQFKTRPGLEVKDPVMTLLRFPSLLALWLERKPELNGKTELLLGNDGDWSRDSARITPLGMAVYLDNLPAVQALLTAGADINATFEINSAVYSPLAFAIKRQGKSTMLLRSKGGLEITR